MIINDPVVTADSISLSIMEPDQFSTDIYIQIFFLFVKTKMGLFGDIGNFFKKAANRVSLTIIKPISHFVSHTIPDVAGKVNKSYRTSMKISYGLLY